MSSVKSTIAVLVRLSVSGPMLALAMTIAAFLICVPVSAQVNTGRLSGAITDQSGGAIAGAKVTVTETATGVARPLITDSAGLYAAPNLNPGIYSVQAEFMGFQTIDRQNIQVGVGSDIRVDLTLQPGAQTETVTVTEALPVINTTNAQTGGTLEQQTLNNLPINGRNYRWQQEWVPGVTISKGNSTGTIDANGTTDGHGSNTLIEGLYSQSYFIAEMTFGGTSESGDTTLLPLDAIQEVNLVTNPKAEYGWIPGVTVNVGLKSGTNNMHGDVYAFGRDQVFYARNPFSKVRTPSAFEQFGATLGGPIKKDKLFYFMGYEGFRDAHFSVVSEVAPVLTSGSGTGLSIPDAIAAINTLGTTPLDNLSLNLAGCNPAMITPAMKTGAAVVTSGACSANQFGAPGLWNNPSLGVLPDDGHSDNGLVKLDYHINDHHALNGSFARGYYAINAAANSAANITQNYWEEILGVKAQMTRVEYIWTPNSSWLNEARWGLDQQQRPTSRAECSNGQDPFTNPLGLGASTGGFGGPNYVTQYGLLSGAPACGLPTIILASPVTAHLSFSNAKAHQETADQGTDVLSYTRGTHQFKFGVDTRAVNFIGAKMQDQQSGIINFGQSGDAAFSGATSLEDFLTGVPSQETIRGGNAIRNVNTFFIAMFAQDDWRITPKLTLNLGLREEILPAPKSITDNLGVFDPTSASGVKAEQSIWNTHYNLLPHLGFAWDVTGKGRTTVRVGAGVANGIQTLMGFIAGGAYSGTGSFDLSGSPTGESLYNAAGVPIVAPGDGKSTVEVLTPTSNGTTVTKENIIWPTNAQNSATTPLFSTPIPEACGNGQPETGNPAIVNPSPCVVAGNPSNFKYYHYIFWNANFEHAFTSSLSLDVGYTGSRSTGLTQTLNLNQVAPNDNPALASSSVEQANAPYEAQFPWFSVISYLNSGGNNNYRAMQVYLVERPAHGLAFTLAYTLADDHTSQGILNIHVPVVGTNGPYSYNAYGLHHIALTANYALPGIKVPGQMLQGWALNGSIVVESSLPSTVSDTTHDLTGAGASEPWTLYGPAAPFNQLYGRAGTIPCYGISGTFAKAPCIPVPAGPAATPWANMPAACIAAATNEAPFTTGLAQGAVGTGLAQLVALGCYEVNGSAIVPPAQGTYGTMLPDELRGPGEGLVNASVTKEWKIKERFTTQFRAEVFNLFNRTQYLGQGTNLGSPNTFGLATGTPDVIGGGGASFSGGPREMQLALKILF